MKTTLVLRGLRWAWLVVLLSAGTAADGATLLGVTLVPDGSANPPGDRLEIVLETAADEKPLAIEVRAYLSSTRPGEAAIPVKSKDAEHRGENGRFLLRREVAPRPAGQAVGPLAVVVPYAALDVPPGAHQLAYEVRGVRGASVLFVQPTEYTSLLITTTPRTAMRVQERSKRSREATDAVEVVDGKLITERVEVEAAEPVHRLVEVAIPGGFLRHGATAQDGLSAFGIEVVKDAANPDLTITKIIPASPAANIGLEVKDGLAQVDGRKLNTAADLIDALDGGGPMLKLLVRNSRDGQLIEVPARLARANAKAFGPAARVPGAGAESGSREEYLAFLHGRPNVPAAEAEPEHFRLVYFATNRAIVGGEGLAPGARFGNAIAPRVTYGSCRVNIPLEVHQAGAIETPGPLNFWNNRDPSKYFLIEATLLMAQEDLLRTLRSKRPGQEDDLIVFVHGFNNPMDDVVLRVAQLAHDTGFPGRALLFSWPSQGSLTAYSRDEEMAAQSGPALAGVLETLVKDRRAHQAKGKVHLIAHSMGNRVLLDALNRVAGLAAADKPFGQIVLAAPDVDLLDFADQSGVLNELGETLTLYSCANDVALKASRGLHSARRLGEQPYFARGLTIENIRADNADTSFLGHGYIVSGTKVLKDLHLLVQLGLSAELRPTLTGMLSPRGGRFWLFR